MSDSPPVSRRLIVIAVSDYGDNSTAFEAGIKDQVEVITGWLTSPALDAERRFALKAPESLLSFTQLRDFLHEQNIADAVDDALVVYVTGHGEKGHRSGRHFLRFAETDIERLPGTALATSDVVSAAVSSSAEHVLVMVDSCFAGSLRAELAMLLEDMGLPRRDLSTLAVITAGDFDDSPSIGSFTSVIGQALAAIQGEEAGFTGPYLSFREWGDLLDEVVRDNPGQVKPRWAWPDKPPDVLSWCLPNPHYHREPDVVSTALRELSVPQALFTTHWHDRASGRASEQDVGWYFSGRADAMRTLSQFLRDGDGMLVVTGAAGSGKSALLARLVTLTDPMFLSNPRFQDLVQAVAPEERPPSGGVDAAVLARGKSSVDLIGDLLNALGAPPVPPGAALVQVLLERIARVGGSGPATIVIDGLDEAHDARACLNDVVLPLGRARTGNGRGVVRLLVGIRSSAQSARTGVGLYDERADELLDLLEESVRDSRQYVHTRVLRTDELDCRSDIAAYAQALLLGGPSTPYTDWELAQATAEAIASATAPSFLDARLAADQLRTAHQVQDLAEEAWLQRLEVGTTALLREDLSEVARDYDVSSTVLLAALRATAFAFGAGLPWSKVWPAVAAALTPAQAQAARDTFDAAIRALLSSRLIGYLAHGEEDGRMVYRPVHQRVSEALLSAPSSLLAGEPAGGEHVVDAQAHARIATSLARLVRGTGGAAVHPYVRRHLVAHADAAGRLVDETVPAEMLPQESSHTLRSRLLLPLPSQDAARTHLTAAALIEPYLAAVTDEDSRASSIRFHASALLGFPRDLPGPYRTARPHRLLWAAATNVLASPPGHVSTLKSFQLHDGRSLLTAGTRHGVHVWDVSSGQHVTDLDTGLVHAQSPIRGSSGRAFLATAGPRGVHIHDPLSGLRVGGLEVAASDVQVVDDGEKRWRLLVRTEFELLLWRPDAGLSALPIRTRQVTSFRDAYGNMLIAYYSAEQGRVRICTDNGHHAGPQPQKLTADRRLMRIPRRGTADLLLALSRSGRQASWDPLTGKVAAMAARLSHICAASGPDGEAAFVALNQDEHAEVWTYTDGRWSRTATVDVGQARALAVLPTHQGLTHLATASDAGIRLWSAPPLDDPASAPLPVPAVNAICHVTDTHTNSTAPRAWGIGTDDGVDIINADNGRSVHSLPTGPVRNILPVWSPDHAVLLAVDTDTGIQVWNHSTDSALFTIPMSGAPGVPTCAVELPPGDSVLCTVSWAGDICLHSLADGRELPAPTCLPPLRRATALASVEGHPGLVAIATDGPTVLVCDLAADLLVAKLRFGGNLPIRTLCTLQTPGGLVLAAGTAQQTRLWNTQTWQVTRTMTTPGVKALNPLPQDNGRDLLVSGDGHSVRVWDPHSGAPLHTLITAAPVQALANSGRPHSLLAFGGPQGFAVVDFSTALGSTTTLTAIGT